MNNLVFLAMGLLCLLLGMKLFYDNVRKIFQWTKVKARVNDHIWDMKASAGSNPVAHEQLQFSTSTGQQMIAKSALAVAKPRKVGTWLAIYYNPQAPQEVMINSIFRIYGPAILLIAFGLLFLYAVYAQ